MLPVLRGGRQFVALMIIAFAGSTLVGVLPGAAADGKGEKSKSQASEPAKVPAASDAKKKEEEAKKKQEQAKKQQEAAAKAMKEARDAYEKEKRELQERLRKDPKWQPSHEQVSVIKAAQKAGTVHSFCLNKDGNLLVCCSGSSSRGLGAMLGALISQPAKTEAVKSGQILVISPEGKQIDAWQPPAEPQAICTADDGTVYVGGAGKLAKLDRNGKTLLTADSPNVAELPPLPAEPAKKAQPKDKDAEAAEKAKQKKLAELRRKLEEAEKKFTKIAEEAGNNLKPDDEKAMEAYQARIKEPMEKWQTLREEVTKLEMTPEQLARQLRQQRERQLTLAGMAVTDRDLFVTCRAAKGYGFVLWRTDLKFANPKKIITNLSGCCSQMDVQANRDGVWIAHNGRHKVEHYDRDGKKLASFGKRDRINAEGFGGCCEPKNLRFASKGELFASESGPPTCVKRFTTDGKFLGVALVAPWDSGCVRVTTEYGRDDKFFVLNTGDRTIHVFAKKQAKADTKTGESAKPKTGE